MKYLYILLFGLVFTSFSSPVYYPLIGEDSQDGCLDYASDEKRIVGIYETKNGYKTVYLYDFEFNIPDIMANSEDLQIRVRRTDGFNTINSCTGSLGMVAKINNIRAYADDLDLCDDGYCITIYPDNPLSVGKNSIFMSNTSEEKIYCHEGHDCPKQKNGICVFRVCGFYPEIDIETATSSNLVSSDENFNLSVKVVNNDEVDAGTVTIKVTESDFDVDPSKTTETILAKQEAPFNELNYVLTFDPKRYTELETGATSVPKRIGKIVATYTDVNGKERSFEKNLGSITVIKPTPSPQESEPIVASTPPEAPSQQSPLPQPETTQEDKSYVCLPGVLLLLPLLFLKSKLSNKA